ncbi:MAG: methylenetetrahydrofolate reductase, partial [Clostridiales bacterium]|nr:methylenetetrahydrofolate reductase [Clostridiales bacterium]
YAEGVRNILLITGDPIPTAERDEVKSVYQFNSRKLAAFVTSLAKKSLPGPFHLFGALNVNARNFDVQLRLAKEKAEKGMVGFLTQPVLTSQAFENLKRAREELDAYLLGGVIPVVSERNARFMDSEINGINVDPGITALYVGKNREEAEDLAVEISSEIMRRISPYVDGYYLMTPFGRTGLMARIIQESISGV